jgi:hypothetical protein
MRKARTIEQHLNRYLDHKGKDECWLWKGPLYRNGYGYFDLCSGQEKRRVMIHRASWELERGEIPDKLTIDHLCKVKRCGNPAHMELVTHGENARRGNVKGSDPCPKGHQLDFVINSRGARVCVFCQKESREAWNEKRRKR